MAYERTIKDQEECTQKLTMANEALANYKGDDANLPKAKAIQKANETSTYTSEAVAPIISQVFQLNSNFLLEEA
jgi:3-hydroxy-3-methylglutaryl CoA synthase